jgi:hypothetical protein
MPPEVRKEWEQVMGMFADRDGDGVPDIFQGSGPEPTVIPRSASVDDTASPAPILPAAQRRSHGDMSPRWGEERPRSLALPWVLVIVLLAVLVWVLLRRGS